MAETPSSGPIAFNVLAALNPATMQGGVALQVGDRKPEFMAPNEARMLAMNLVGAADAADFEAAFVEWANEHSGLLSTADEALADFRRVRTIRAKRGIA